MDIKFIASRRGKSVLVLDNFRYNFHKESKSGEMKWRCSNRQCRSLVSTLGPLDENVKIIKRIGGEHNHKEANVNDLNRQMVSGICKRIAVENLTEKPSKIIRRYIQDNVLESFTSKDFKCIRKHLYQARRSHNPTLPKDIEDPFGCINMNESARHESGDMNWNDEKTIRFIEDYHNKPELWNIRNSSYKDNKVKYEILKELANKYECSVLEVKKKIQQLRASFHRERRKIQQSGSSPAEKDKWFAFDLLSFLLDVDQPQATTASDEDVIKDGSISESQDISKYVAGFQDNTECQDIAQSHDNSGSQLSTSKRRKTRSSCISPTDQKNILKSAYQRDECSTYGEHVANELRNLGQRSRTIVKHLMNNILFEAAMGKYETDKSFMESGACSDSTYSQMSSEHVK